MQGPTVPRLSTSFCSNPAPRCRSLAGTCQGPGLSSQEIPAHLRASPAPLPGSRGHWRPLPQSWEEEQTCRGHTLHLSHISGSTSPSSASRKAGPAFLKMGVGWRGGASVALGESHSADPKGVPPAGGGGGDPSKPLPSLCVKSVFFPPKKLRHSFLLNSQKHW